VGVLHVKKSVWVFKGGGGGGLFCFVCVVFCWVCWVKKKGGVFCWGGSESTQKCQTEGENQKGDGRQEGTTVGVELDPRPSPQRERFERREVPRKDHHPTNRRGEGPKTKPTPLKKKTTYMRGT